MRLARSQVLGLTQSGTASRWCTCCAPPVPCKVSRHLQPAVSIVVVRSLTKQGPRSHEEKKQMEARKKKKKKRGEEDERGTKEERKKEEERRTRRGKRGGRERRKDKEEKHRGARVPEGAKLVARTWTVSSAQVPSHIAFLGLQWAGMFSCRVTLRNFWAAFCCASSIAWWVMSTAPLFLLVWRTLCPLCWSLRILYWKFMNDQCELAKNMCPRLGGHEITCGVSLTFRGIDIRFLGSSMTSVIGGEGSPTARLHGQRGFLRGADCKRHLGGRQGCWLLMPRMATISSPNCTALCSLLLEQCVI